MKTTPYDYVRHVHAGTRGGQGEFLSPWNWNYMGLKAT